MPYKDIEYGKQQAAKKKLERAAAGPPENMHGTRIGYFGYDCRCDPCKLAAKKYSASKRILKVRKHGGITRINQHGTSGMWAKGCRCADCSNYKQVEHRLYTYGLTQKVYLQILERQNNLCAICKIGPAEHVDHCHETNKIRGVLCRNCNWGLGYFKDNQQFLSGAIDYLKDVI